MMDYPNSRAPVAPTPFGDERIGVYRRSVRLTGLYFWFYHGKPLRGLGWTPVRYRESDRRFCWNWRRPSSLGPVPHWRSILGLGASRLTYLHKTANGFAVGCLVEKRVSESQKTRLRSSSLYFSRHYFSPDLKEKNANFRKILFWIPFSDSLGVAWRKFSLREKAVR